MAMEKLDRALEQEVAALKAEGRAKAPERVIVDYIPPRGEWGPRYRLQGSDQEPTPTMFGWRNALRGLWANPQLKFLPLPTWLIWAQR